MIQNRCSLKTHNQKPLDTHASRSGVDREVSVHANCLSFWLPFLLSLTLSTLLSPCFSIFVSLPFSHTLFVSLTPPLTLIAFIALFLFFSFFSLFLFFLSLSSLLYLSFSLSSILSNQLLRYTLIHRRRCLNTCIRPTFQSEILLFFYREI